MCVCTRTRACFRMCVSLVVETLWDSVPWNFWAGFPRFPQQSCLDYQLCGTKHVARRSTHAHAHPPARSLAGEGESHQDVLQKPLLSGHFLLPLPLLAVFLGMQQLRSDLVTHLSHTDHTRGCLHWVDALLTHYAHTHAHTTAHTILRHSPVVWL